MASKTVYITLALSSEFISNLAATVGISGLHNFAQGGAAESRQLTGMETLAVAAMMEARGATEEEVALAIQPEWRAHIGIQHEERRVYQDGKQLSQPTPTQLELAELAQYRRLLAIGYPGQVQLGRYPKLTNEQLREWEVLQDLARNKLGTVQENGGANA